MSLQDDTSSVKTALDFLKFIYPTGPWTITSIIDNPDPQASNPVIIRGRTFHERQIGDLSRYIDDLNGKVNLYWQVNPLRTDPGNKAKLQDVQEVVRLHVDIDPRKGTHDRESERQLITSLLEDEKRLKAMGLPGGPSFIIDSGNGFWGFWDLIDPVPLVGATIEEVREHAADIGRYNRALAELFNAELKGELGDQCHNVDRISRLPGTMNIPDAKKRAAGFPVVPARIYANYPDRVYSLNQFSQSDVISWGAGATEEDFKRIEIGEIVRILPGSNDPWEIGQEFKRQFPQVGEKILELITLGEYLDDREAGINDKLTPQGLATNRSKAHWRVNRSLQQYGVPLNVILGILCDERLPISAHGREPIDEKTGRRSALRSGRELIRFNERQIKKCTVSIAKQREEEARAEALLTEEVSSDAGYGSTKSSQSDQGGETKASGPKKKQPTTPAEVVKELNDHHAVLLQEGGKTLVLSWEKTEVDKNRESPVLQTFTDFKNRYMNRLMQTGKNKKTGDPIFKSWAEIWLASPKRREFFGLRFYPGDDEVVDGYLNMWRGWPVQPKAGDWSLMRDHIFHVLAGGNQEYFDYIMDWSANAVQNPSLPAEVALVFRGGRGTGKGTFARALKRMFGQHGLQITASAHLTGKFNAHLRDCCLLFADEAIRPEHKDAVSILNGLITEPEIPIERKRIDLSPARNHLHIVMASNDEWVIPAGIDERRFAVFDVSPEHQQSKEYFAPLYEQIDSDEGLAAMLHELLNRDIKGWHPRNSVPQTSALKSQKQQGLSPFDQFILNILEEGALPGPTSRVYPMVVFSLDRKNDTGLYTNIRQSSPKLRDWSYQRLASKLKEWGCSNATDGSQRGWEFPLLNEMRRRWDECYWEHSWPDPEANWVGVHDEVDEDVPF